MATSPPAAPGLQRCLSTFQMADWRSDIVITHGTLLRVLTRDSDSVNSLGPVSSGHHTFKSQVVEAIRISEERVGNATDHAELYAAYVPVTRA